MKKVLDQVDEKFTEIRDEIPSLADDKTTKLLDRVTPLFLTIRLVDLHLYWQRRNVWRLKDAFRDLKAAIEAQPELAWEGDASKAAKEYERIVYEFGCHLGMSTEKIAWGSSRLKGKRLQIKEYTIELIQSCVRGDIDVALLKLREHL